MTAGVPMDERETEFIREALESGPHREVVVAIREADRRVFEMWSTMTNEEIANWILGIE